MGKNKSKEPRYNVLIRKKFLSYPLGFVNIGAFKKETAEKKRRELAARDYDVKLSKVRQRRR
jgi:hypothetical protein